MPIDPITSRLRPVALALAALLAPPAFAQAASPATAPPDTLARIAAARAVTLGVRTDAAPFSFIDQMGKIMEMRRFLTLEGRLTGSAVKTLQKLQTQGNPWGFSGSDRAVSGRRKMW